MENKDQEKKDHFGEILIDWILYMVSTIYLSCEAKLLGWPDYVHIVLWGQFIIMCIFLLIRKISFRFFSITFVTFLVTAIGICGIYNSNYQTTMVLFIGSAVMTAIFRNYHLVIHHCVLTIIAMILHGLVFKVIGVSAIDEILNFVASVIILIGISITLIFIILHEKTSRRKLELVAIEANKAEKSKSDFLANMSHEIRTPMNAIIGMCELALRDVDNTRNVRECCNSIQNSSRSLLSIINDILDFSKIESGKIEIIEDEFNIGSTINDVVNMAETRLGDKPISLIVDVDPNIPQGLIGDELRIRQIIINLVTNAIKYTKRGIIKLSISMNVRKYGINLNISIEDTGIGISKENIEKLFNSFQQIDTKKNREVEGTGLGLAITKKLLKQMGGFINVKSEYGKGSQFKIVIPLKVKNASPFVHVNNGDSIVAVAYMDENRTEDQLVREKLVPFLSGIGKVLNVRYRYFYNFSRLIKRIAKGDVTHCFVDVEDYLLHRKYFDDIEDTVTIVVVQDRRNVIDVSSKVKYIYKPINILSIASVLNNEEVSVEEHHHTHEIVSFVAPRAKILIVDDNSINLQVAVGLLRPYNMQVITSSSGEDAIRLLESKDFDLVFMDHMMPVMDGVEATKIIRSKDDPYYVSLPIVALTANAVQGARDMFLSNGFNGFLAKPIELSALDRVLKQQLRSELIEKRNAMPLRDKSDSEDEVKILSESLPKEIEGIIDLKTGYSYTGGNMKAYLTILGSYVKKGQDKLNEIKLLYEKEDWKNYIIEVHALKSSSMTVGAVKLSELAKELELKGKAGDIDTIINKNEELLAMYRTVIDAGCQLLESQKNDSAEDNSKSDNNENNGDDASNTKSVTREDIESILSDITNAVDAFDSDHVLEIVQEAKNSVFDGENLSAFFEKIENSINDFDYDVISEYIEDFWKQHGES